MLEHNFLYVVFWKLILMYYGVLFLFIEYSLSYKEECVLIIVGVESIYSF